MGGNTCGLSPPVAQRARVLKEENAVIPMATSGDPGALLTPRAAAWRTVPSHRVVSYLCIWDTMAAWRTVPSLRVVSYLCIWDIMAAWRTVPSLREYSEEEEEKHCLDESAYTLVSFLFALNDII